MAATVSLGGIDEAISNLNYRNPKALKSKLVHAIRSFFEDEHSLVSLEEIDAEALVKALWDTGDDPDVIRAKRKNLSSTKSSVNSDLKRLFKEGNNPDGVVIGRDNVFVMSDEAKDKLISTLGAGDSDGEPVSLHQIAQSLSAIKEILSMPGIWDNAKGSEASRTLEDLRDAVKHLGNKIGVDEKASVPLEAEPEAEPEEEVEEEPVEEPGEIEQEAVDEADVVEEVIAPEEAEPEEAESEEPEEIEDEELDEVIEEIDADAALEEAESEEEVEEPEVEGVPEESEIEEVEAVDDDDIDEVLDELDLEEDLQEEGLDEEVEEEPVEEPEETEEEEAVDEADVVEEVLEPEEAEPEEIDEEDVVDETDPVEEVLEAEEAEPEDVEEVEDDALDEALDVVDEDDTPEELETDEELDEAEVEDGLEEIEVADDLEAAEADDDAEQAELLEDSEQVGLPVDSLGEGSPDADVDVEKARRLAEAFDGHLGAMERFYNQYLLIPSGEYIVGSMTPKMHERPGQTVRLPSFYMGKFPVTNSLFEIFVEKTGYVTTAEKQGHGTVFYGRLCKEVDETTGLIKFRCNVTVNSKIVRGAFWYQPSGPGTTLHHKRDHPVVQVSLEDARAFAAWTGKRLPTEDEWEAASRTADGYVLPWGMDWEDQACNIEDTAVGETTPVDAFKDLTNELAIVDTLGNVLEWTSDVFEPSHDAKNAPRYHIAKGGSWVSEKQVRLFSRFKVDPHSSSNILGFRCVAY